MALDDGASLEGLATRDLFAGHAVPDTHHRVSSHVDVVHAWRLVNGPTLCWR